MDGKRKPSPAETTAASPAAAASVVLSEILTVAEVAALLKVPSSSVYEWTRFRTHQRVPLPHSGRLESIFVSYAPKLMHGWSGFLGRRTLGSANTPASRMHLRPLRLSR